MAITLKELKKVIKTHNRKDFERNVEKTTGMKWKDLPRIKTSEDFEPQWVTVFMPDEK